jgi:hypothetical protein
MAQPPLDQFRKRLLTLAVEAVEGVDEVPTALANAILLMNGSSGTEFDAVERPIDRPHFTNDPFVVANRRAFIEGDFELFPPATPGAAATSDAVAAPLLLPAGFTVAKDDVAKTTRYNPISSGIVSSSAYWYHTGTLIRAIGSRHNITQLGIQVGNRFMGRVRVQGRYTAMTETALPTGTLSPVVPVVASYLNSEASITVGAGSPLTVWAKGLSVDLGNELAQKEYTDLNVNTISDRRGTWTMRIARTDLGDFNPLTVRDAGTIVTARIRTYNADNRVGLYSEIGIRGQIEQVQAVDIDGDYGFELSGRCIASDAGGDELYLLFGDNTP